MLLLGSFGTALLWRCGHLWSDGYSFASALKIAYAGLGRDDGSY